MPITDEALLQMMFKQHEGQPIEFIMAEYGKAKRLYLEIEQGLAQGAKGPTIEVVDVQVSGELPESGSSEKAAPKKRYTKRNLKCDPKEAIKEDDIICCLCGEKFKALYRHLMAHDISAEDYKKLCGYPEDEILMSKQGAKKAEKRGKELAKARAEKLAAKAAPEAAQAAQEAAPAAE